MCSQYYVSFSRCYLELELHGLEGGGGLDAPGPGVLSDVHLGGGHGGGLPQQEAHVKGLESENHFDKLSSSEKCRHLKELLVLVGGGSGVTSLKSVHF